MREGQSARSMGECDQCNWLPSFNSQLPGHDLLLLCGAGGPVVEVGSLAHIMKFGIGREVVLIIEPHKGLNGSKRRETSEDRTPLEGK